MKMGIKRNLAAANLDNKDQITEDEAALYDRQIRLWGMECQKRLREAKLLVVGLNGVGAEVVKNLTLSGVKSISILDETMVTEADRSAQFFVSGCENESGVKRGELSKRAIQELNPNVSVNIITGDIFEKPENFFSDIAAMIATDCTVDTLIKLDELCRKHNMQFYCTDTWGFYGYCFLDLNVHVFTNKVSSPIPTAITIDKAETKKVAKETVTKQTLNYCPLAPTMLAKVGEGVRKRVNKVFVLMHVVNHFREMFNRLPSAAERERDIAELKKLRKIVCEKLGFEESKISDEMLSGVFGQLSPVCSVVGGILANEIIKGISRNGLPVHNYCFFDGNESVCVNETILIHNDK